MIIEPRTIDFKKYKRFFAFGCSFTQWRWPTWYDIIKTQLAPGTECYNTGRGGAGNLYIALQYSQFKEQYKFTDTDLVVIMWTTFMREDRYLRKCWLTPGNIFTQNIYSEEYVRQYADTRGYLIRDLGLIDLTTTALENSREDAVALLSVSALHDSDDDVEDVLRLYNGTLTKYPKSFHDYFGRWNSGHNYYHPGFDKGPAKSVDEPHTPNYEDYHPNTLAHYEYLKYLGFNLDATAEQYSKETVDRYNSYTHYLQFMNEHPKEIL